MCSDDDDADHLTGSWWHQGNKLANNSSRVVCLFARDTWTDSHGSDGQVGWLLGCLVVNSLAGNIVARRVGRDKRGREGEDACQPGHDLPATFVIVARKFLD